MSDEKFSLGDKKLGKVKRIIKSSGMLELTSGEKIPPFPNVEVGDEIGIKNKRYHIVGKGAIGTGNNDVDENKDVEGLKKENKTLKAQVKKQEARLAALEKTVGEKGEAKKAEGDVDAKK